MSDASPRNINSGKPFARAYEAYIDKGWLGVIPLPAGQKHPPPVGWTGRNARHPEQEDIDAWLMKVKYKNANIGLHLGVTSDDAYELIGIDVDNYEDKAGGDQLKRLEAQHGTLPATWVSSSRPLPSGIRFYRVPKGYAFIGKASSAIDIIQRAHRYAVVWPSWNPDSDAQYYWRSPTGERVERLEDLPDANTLPVLSPDDPSTASWFDFLTRGGMEDTGEEIDMDMSVDEVFQWARGNFRQAVSDDDNVCSKMQGAVDYWVSLIDAEESSHDKITGAHWNIIALGSEGHYDWTVALEEVEKVYISNTLKRGKRTVEDLRGEVGRSKINALRKIKAQIESGKRALSNACKCYTPTDEDLALVAAALKAQSSKGKGAGPTASAAGVGVATSAAQRSEDDGSGDGSGIYPDGMPSGIPNDPGDYEMSDFGNGEHWRKIFNTHAYFIPEYGEWVMWNGVEWIKGEGMANRSYRAVAQRQRSYAEQLSNVALALVNADDPRAKSALGLARRWTAWADRSGMVGAQESALKSAANHMILHERELNNDSYALGVANGVLRLNRDEGTVSLNDMTKDHFITLNTGTPYVPWDDMGEYEEDADFTESIIEEWIPDYETRNFLQKCVGYSLLGHNRERLSFWLVGPTSTGKSSFLNMVQMALGDYSGTVDLSIFRGDRHTNPQLVDALPKRIITTNEASQSNVLHADVFKRITSGEPISAELKYSNEMVNRAPSFTPWIATNSSPSIPGSDSAVERRIITIPFTTKVAESTRVGERLTDSKGVRVAALSWAVEGWRMYAAEGFRENEIPESVREAKAEFTSDLSDLATFIKERMRRSEIRSDTWPEEWKIPASEVYDEYEDWCIENRTPDRNRLTRRQLVSQMQQNGIAYRVTKYRGAGTRCFLGVQLTRLKTVQPDGN